MPRSSKAAKLQHSDSESTIAVKHKRQKLDNGHGLDGDITMADDSQRPNYDPNKNGKLKGRKRFNADLVDLQEAVKFGLVFDSLVVKGVRSGDDEGSVEVVIKKDNSEHVISANFLISDTSEYPNSHSLFCYTPDGDASAKIQKIIDEMSDEPARPLGCIIRGFVLSLARVVFLSASKVRASPPEEPSDEEGTNFDEGDDFDAFDFDDDLTTAPESDSVMSKIQETFIDIVATEYRPGFIRLPGNDFVLSICLPVITLANLIPPRALMAWDRRLLASSQHLTLLISGFHGLYPVLESNATYTSAAQRLGVCLNFKVGLSARYKPGVDQVRETIRKHGLIVKDAEDEMKEQLAAHQARFYECGSDQEDNAQDPALAVQEEVIDPNRFDRFSLSSSLESLMDQSFLKLVQIRRRFGLGWAGAEILHAESEKTQMPEADILAAMVTEINNEDREESRLSNLPYDPLENLKNDEPFNLPLTAFCYLIRRLALCTRYCTACHNRLQSDYEALKPYVCDSKLCAYQYYTLNRGPSLEYEIMQNSQTVDLLVSLAYVSAGDGAMDDPLPIGMGLRVPLPKTAAPTQLAPTFPSYYPVPPVVPEVPNDLQPGPDGLVDFDELTRTQMRACIVKLIDTLPSVMDMKKHLEQKAKPGKRKPKLQDIDPEILPAAWSILRWCVASCTAHIEAITSPEETIKNLDPVWTQFRMTVGAPAAEANFREAIAAAEKKDANVKEYPVIYAFHGSALRNWHSIIRHGLWYKTVTHGRAYGHGVYLAKDGTTSVGYYAQAGCSSWSKSLVAPSNCMALAEVVNLPSKFVSENPHYVVKDTHWIMCRYLLVKGAAANSVPTTSVFDADLTLTVQEPKKKKKKRLGATPYVRLDPQHKTQMAGKVIVIPDPAFQLENLLAARNVDYIREDADDDDMAIFQLDVKKTSGSNSQPKHLDYDDDYLVPVASSSATKIVKPPSRPKNDWKHDAKYVEKTLENLMLPPFQSTPLASLAIQRELKGMIKEQDAARSLKDLGWYMPPELIGDNLYQWIVEMHSFDPALPIAKDLKAKKVNSIIFEIRFPPLFPNLPPFFRIITPRFLPFIQGGGGHVTGGGSICMDLLTSDGWLPSYSISAVLMQIRLAISNLEPRPARLAHNWNQPYGIGESLAGYKRAAATHNWTVPEGLDHLVR